METFFTDPALDHTVLMARLLQTFCEIMSWSSDAEFQQKARTKSRCSDVETRLRGSVRGGTSITIRGYDLSMFQKPCHSIAAGLGGETALFEKS